MSFSRGEPSAVYLARSWALATCRRRSNSGLVAHRMLMSGWSDRFCPTPGASISVSMPCSPRWSDGPTPESMRICGDPIAPALRITSSASTTKFSSPDAASTPVARGPLAGRVEQYSLDRHVGPNGQIQPVARQAQVADGRRPADAVRVVQRRGPDAGGAGRVVVLAVRQPVVAPGLEPGHVALPPLLAGEAVADDGPARAVEVAGVVLVGGVRLHHVEVGHELLEAPLVVSPLGPVVVVLRNAADEYLPVDGAGAAGHPAPGHVYGRRAIGGPGLELPVVVAVPDALGGQVAVLHLLRQAVHVGVVRTRLQEQHRGVGVLGESRGENRARRACADDDVVVLHPLPPEGRAARWNAGCFAILC